jgi:hypothetical protein
MQSLAAAARTDGFTTRPISLRQVMQRHNTRSGLELIASQKVADVYRR